MWDKTKECKVCGTCKQEFPKTDEFFYKRTISQKNKNGVVAVYQSFRSSCISCIKEKNKREKKPVCTTCRKCGNTYDNVDDNFSKTYKRIDGSVLYGRVCKSCKKLTRKKNKASDKSREYTRRWIAKNKDRIIEYRREYRKDNKEAVLKREKEYRDKDPSRHRLSNKKWYSKNKDKVLNIQLAYYQRHKERLVDEGIIKSIKKKYGLDYVPKEIQEFALAIANAKRYLKQVNN